MEENVTYYTPSEVAERLKVSERTVRRWIREGELGAQRYGRQLRIPDTALRAFGEAATAEEVEDESDDMGWSEISLGVFEADWDNALDADYDRWREVYGVPEG